MKSLRKQKKRFSLKEHKSLNDSRKLGCMIGNAVRAVIRQEQRHQGLLNPKNEDDHCGTNIESCKKRFTDQDGNIKPMSGLTEMKLQWGNPKDEQPKI
ncbi:hypothetical protein [Acinetobacter ursingii]|uniref:hypothetical protein n=1 Tax=Acinetobacter ursingii TaxID=108980 RepID=UPI00124FCCA0|nr:hypothetical protein [Acinetobacter ursingii]